MKKKFILMMAGVLALSFLCLAKPNWNRVNHISSTIFTAAITVDGKPASKEAYVGAFKDGECRMIAPIIINNDTAYVSSVIHGDTSEEVQFRIWLSEGNELTSKKTITTKPGESILMETIQF